MNPAENNNNHVTTDDLAVMIKKGFDGVDEQFKSVNKRLDGVDERLERVELRLDNVAYRFELNELKQRVFVLEQKAGIAE